MSRSNNRKLRLDPCGLRRFRGSCLELHCNNSPVATVFTTITLSRVFFRKRLAQFSLRLKSLGYSCSIKGENGVDCVYTRRLLLPNLLLPDPPHNTLRPKPTHEPFRHFMLCTHSMHVDVSPHHALSSYHLSGLFRHWEA